MSLALEQLLAPISSESPCGSNAYDDLDLGGILSSTLEAVVGGGDGGMVESAGPSAGTGDWSGLLANVGGYFGQTKHLGLAKFALLADLHISGLSGLADGVVLLNQLLSRYWDAVYPIIEDGDAEERLSILTGIDDPLVIEGLGTITVCKGKRAGSYSLDQICSSELDGDPSPTLVEASINETLSDTPDFYERLGVQLVELRQQLNFLRNIVKERLPNEQIRFPGIESKLVVLEGFLSKVGAEPTLSEAGYDDDDEGSADVSAGKGPKVAVANGDITSRADVVKQLDRIIRFYSKSEPTSPVPHLLNRAKKVVNMNFMEIVEEFRLNGNPSIPELFGTKEED